MRTKERAVTFQPVIDVSLETVKWQCAFVYRYDVGIFLEDIKKNLIHVASVFRMFTNAGVTMKLRK